MKKEIKLLPLDIQTFATSEELFYEVLSAPALATVAEQNPNLDDPYLGPVLFPPVKTEGLKLGYIKDSKGLPMALKPSQFDTKAPIRDRANVELMEGEMPFFREGMILGERERQELFDALRRSPQSYQTVLARLYNDQMTLVEGADVQAERLRMQALSTGKIEVVANGEYLAFDYDVPTNHIETLSGTNVWTDENADIIGLVSRAKKTIRKDTGKVITAAVMTSDTFELLLKNKQVKALLNPLAVNSAIVLEDQVKTALEQALKITIVIYDKMFIDEEGNAKELFPTGVVTFIPSGNLGNTHYGTTPEEFDLMNTTNHRAQVSIVNTGVAITTYKQEHPVNSKTLVSQIVMPSFEQARNIYIANVMTP